MRAHKTIATLLCFCVFSATVAYCADESAKEKAAATAVAPWLALVDSGQYGESWFQGASSFRNAMSKEQWTNALTSVRTPLGKLQSREVKTATYTTNLPNVPSGEYVVLKYDTNFANASGMIETVIATLEKDGKWKVSGYFIKRTGG